MTCFIHAQIYFNFHVFNAIDGFSSGQRPLANASIQPDKLLVLAQGVATLSIVARNNYSNRIKLNRKGYEHVWLGLLEASTCIYGIRF